MLRPKKHGEQRAPRKKVLSRGGGGKPPPACHIWPHPDDGNKERGEMPLTAIVDEYVDSRDLCHNYRRHLMRTAERMSASGLTSVADLTPQRVTRWLDSLPCSKTTRANYRRQALTIIRAALGPGATYFSEGVRRVKHSLPPPVAWTQEELSRLLHHARHLPGNLQSGCPVRVFFTAWLLTGYSCGLRFSDLLNLRSSQIREGRLYTVQSKTGDPLVQVLPHDCVKALSEIIELSPDGTVFRWALAEKWLRVRWDRLVKEAKVTGTCKWMRRTGATWVEATAPGQASRFLGHRSPELAMKHYVDRSLLPNSCPSPPPIQ